MQKRVTGGTYRDLCDAIILQAVHDYRNALRGVTYDEKPVKSVVRECERFFRSEYFRLLTKISPEYLIESLKKEVEDENYSDSRDSEPH